MFRDNEFKFGIGIWFKFEFTISKPLLYILILEWLKS